jgi:hypothetical protein
MVRLLIIAFAAFALSACGGGGGPGSFGDTAIIKSYPSDGSGVAVSENIYNDSGVNYNATMIVSDRNNAHKIADALYRANNGLLYYVDGENTGYGFYWFAIEGINPNGEIIEIDGWGRTLETSNFVSMSAVSIDDFNTFSVATDGSVLNGMPSGSFRYDGASELIGGVRGEAIEEGDLTLVANFNNSTASLTALSNNKFLTADNLRIDRNGKISGEAQIGIISINTSGASVTGYFAGNNAAGVHGVAYQNADVDNGMGAVFMGWR